MAISYQSKDSLLLGLQLKVQEVTVKLADAFCVTAASTHVTIDLKEPVAEVRGAVFFDDSVEIAMVPVANQTISGTTVALELGVAMTADDVIVLRYVVAE